MYPGAKNTLPSHEIDDENSTTFPLINRSKGLKWGPERGTKNSHLVVELALVLVAVSVYGTEEAAAPAGEPGQPHLLLAHTAPVLLLLAVLTPGLVPAGGPGGGAGLGVLPGLGLGLRPDHRHRGLGGL